MPEQEHEKPSTLRNPFVWAASVAGWAATGVPFPLLLLGAAAVEPFVGPTPEDIEAERQNLAEAERKRHERQDAERREREDWEAVEQERRRVAIAAQKARERLAALRGMRWLTPEQRRARARQIMMRYDEELREIMEM